MKDIYAEPGNTPDAESTPDVQSNPDVETAPDVESDPALDDRVGSDWSDEGGAAPSGPATSTAADDPEDDPVGSDGETDAPLSQ